MLALKSPNQAAQSYTRALATHRHSHLSHVACRQKGYFVFAGLLLEPPATGQAKLASILPPSYAQPLAGGF